MNPSQLILFLALAAGTAVAIAAPATAMPDTMSAYGIYSGASIVAQNEAEKHRLEAQGFPQYND